MRGTPEVAPLSDALKKRSAFRLTVAGVKSLMGRLHTRQLSAQQFRHPHSGDLAPSI
ncbi:hypothetical protein LC612_38380 [Nostoc sp. CHAB 5834]|nr:hypothetical protein [Nostoc sp. CHAB 5834]